MDLSDRELGAIDALRATSAMMAANAGAIDLRLPQSVLSLTAKRHASFVSTIADTLERGDVTVDILMAASSLYRPF